MSIQQTTWRRRMQAVRWLNGTLVAGTLLFAAVGMAQDSPPAARPAWTGAGQYRLLVEVAARPLVGRERDKRPAELAIDWRQVARQFGGTARTPDIRSLQFIQYDPATGQPREYGDYGYQRSAADRPFRWYDDAIPYEFPEFGQAVTRTGGRIVRRNVVRGGYFFNMLGDWQAGRLAWSHTQLGQDTSHYAIYFDWLPAGDQPDQLPPRGWLGDGTPRCDESGGSTMAADHSRVDVDDWNQDGWMDVIASAANGRVRVYLNRGELSGKPDSNARFDDGFDPGLPPIMQPRVLMADLNGDGDDDLFIPGTQGACFVERSFLDGGYAPARLLVVERKGAGEQGGGTP